MSGFSHLDGQGRPQMVDLSEKRERARTAAAQAALSACLTPFDILKAIDRAMEVGAISAKTKSGGKSGSWDGK